MNTLLFYKNPVPLNREVHRNARLKVQAEGFKYAASTNALPVSLVEFPNVGVECPIVFALDPNSQEGAPLALVGLRDNENLFVSEDNQWNGDYVPAFVRRYPFALYEQPNSNELFVLVDDQAAGFNAPDGEPLFTEDGKESPLLAQALQFIEYFKGEGEHVKAFVTVLRKHDLLIPRTIDVNMPDGSKISMGGFHVVDEERLKNLSDQTLVEMARSGDLPRIYTHLLSLNNLPKLLRRLEPRLNADKPAAA